MWEELDKLAGYNTLITFSFKIQLIWLFILNIVFQLSNKLREKTTQCQTLQREKCERLGIEYEEPAEIIREDQLALYKSGSADQKILEESLSNQLSFHVIGPLIESYEQTIALLQKEITNTKFKFK